MADAQSQDGAERDYTYQKRFQRKTRAMKEIDELLATTAYVILDDKKKRVIDAAIKAEVGPIIDRILNNEATNTRVNYKAIAMDVVRAAFTKNLGLFILPGEDEPVLAELFDFGQ